MKLPQPILPWLCALAWLCATGASAQDSEPITRVVPVTSPSPTPATPSYPDTTLPPIGSGPDASPAAAPAVTSPTPAPAMEPAAPPVEQTSPQPAPDQTPEMQEPEPAPEATPEPPPSPYSIEIDLNKQRAYLLEDGRIIEQSPISSGRPGHLTPTGDFSVIQKDLNHFSNLYGSFVSIKTGDLVKSGADAAMPTPKGCKFVPAPMKWFMRFAGASGMHAGILPGYAASHGCIRMPASKAELFYNTVDVGTPVHVFGVAPPPEFREEKKPVRMLAVAKAMPPPHKHFLFW